MIGTGKWFACGNISKHSVWKQYISKSCVWKVKQHCATLTVASTRMYTRCMSLQVQHLIDIKPASLALGCVSSVLLYILSAEIGRAHV